MIDNSILHKILEKTWQRRNECLSAEDTKLKRQAAIKFFPNHISVNEKERKRFEIEAQAEAALTNFRIGRLK